MAQLKDLIVNGATRLVDKLFADEVSVTKINDVAVGNSPKFTDTIALSSMTGTYTINSVTFNGVTYSGNKVVIVDKLI